MILLPPIITKMLWKTRILEHAHAKSCLRALPPSERDIYDKLKATLSNQFKSASHKINLLEYQTQSPEEHTAGPWLHIILTSQL